MFSLHISMSCWIVMKLEVWWLKNKGFIYWLISMKSLSHVTFINRIKLLIVFFVGLYYHLIFWERRLNQRLAVSANLLRHIVLKFNYISFVYLTHFCFQLTYMTLEILADLRTIIQPYRSNCTKCALRHAMAIQYYKNKKISNPKT